MKVLVADDDPTSRLIAKVAVEHLGHECRTTSDGTDAWETFRSWLPEAFISDWMMPGMTGLQLCRAVRSEPPGPYTYFIMITSQRAADEVLEGMSAGVDDYLVKPLNTDDLEGRLIAAQRVTSLHRELAHQRTNLEDVNNELTDIARRDPLTGLGNRRALEEDLELLEARVSRYGHQYCMALVDVDHFKSFNDTYGHQAGDEILQAVASELRREARGGDEVYRYGGDEFLCIFPEQTLDRGRLAVERMSAGLERLAISHSDNVGGLLTFSAGLAVLDPKSNRSAEQVLKEADEALYRAKDRGRNRVECAASERS
jgi:two-component system chemotaxis response regulator CheY